MVLYIYYTVICKQTYCVIFRHSPLLLVLLSPIITKAAITLSNLDFLS